MAAAAFPKTLDDLPWVEGAAPPTSSLQHARIQVDAKADLDYVEAQLTAALQALTASYFSSPPEDHPAPDAAPDARAVPPSVQTEIEAACRTWLHQTMMASAECVDINGVPYREAMRLLHGDHDDTVSPTPAAATSSSSSSSSPSSSAAVAPSKSRHTKSSAPTAPGIVYTPLDEPLRAELEQLQATVDAQVERVVAMRKACPQQLRQMVQARHAAHLARLQQQSHAALVAASMATPAATEAAPGAAPAAEPPTAAPQAGVPQVTASRADAPHADAPHVDTRLAAAVLLDPALSAQALEDFQTTMARASGAQHDLGAMLAKLRNMQGVMEELRGYGGFELDASPPTRTATAPATTAAAAASAAAPANETKAPVPPKAAKAGLLSALESQIPVRLDRSHP
ncbi:hypothetical protein CXG81DRAFT_27449 [Caulochytrium protostelioides]|uniref:Uncharacterized protein n=1 Tax=Caulochytrium protostelioides TaxID=1555241 RepID=A0A4P9X444_9FUNG|nr:hypothetical protein CXG81DRAFT_27449 [Caulochytrium protostelioides]|eukprot:RKO99823.1 hypothetical protein CXG81DRAFT_27449 [Caulochytrium protostelioides]